MFGIWERGTRMKIFFSFLFILLGNNINENEKINNLTIISINIIKNNLLFVFKKKYICSLKSFLFSLKKTFLKVFFF